MEKIDDFLLLLSHKKSLFDKLDDQELFLLHAVHDSRSHINFNDWPAVEMLFDNDLLIYLDSIVLILTIKISYKTSTTIQQDREQTIENE